ncbi:uncharacterized protein [Rutidosis leptorrhynchoides]|uniref:uncharacterized protein n=1 Tax=Rutidosis leptorrhynchoides TaxID=125765 RepID=UPI003A994136
MLKQKARLRWNLEGDENTRFYHSVIQGKQNKSNIKGFLVQGTWVENPIAIKTAVFDHFSKLFMEPEAMRPTLEELFYPILTTDEASTFEGHFTEEEIWNAIKDCGSSKAPGPDGFNFHFFKKFWSIIKSDLIDATTWFWDTGEISKGCNASFITLVPKKADALGLGDFRPISLIGSYYKIVVKILSNRLRKVIPSLVGPEQSGFLKDRYILDGVLVANETIDFLKANHPLEVDLVANHLGCLRGEFPFTYLGLPIGSKMKKLNDWSPVIDKFNSRLSGWRMRSLSFEGRLVLIKSVLNSLPLYYFSLYRASPCVIKLLERVRRSFFWGGSGEGNNISWVSWENVINYFGNGGLNLGSLKAKNLALLGKWWWSFKIETDSLWVKIIRSLYGINGGLLLEDGFTSNSSSSTWNNIISAGIMIDELQVPFKNSFIKSIGDGGRTSFWREHWIGADKLCKLFPRLYRLESNQEVSVRYRAASESQGAEWCWNWLRSPSGRAVGELHSLTNLLSSVTINRNSSDKWKWVLSSNGLFTVKKLATLIDEHLLSPFIAPQETLRNSLVPKKIEIFCWRLMKKRLPIPTASSIPQLLNANTNSSMSTHGKKIWNNVIFNGKSWSTPMIVSEIQVKSFDWISAKFKGWRLEWLTWLTNPCTYLNLS